MASLLLALIYLCFISLGLPDSLLGSAWPVLHTEISVPVSYAGLISMTIFIGTILSSLFSDKLLRRFGAGKVTAFSVIMTAIPLFGFATSTRFWMLILWSIPYGLGAGGVDAILNNYVALHYKAQHMSWLHCMWGVGASISPYIMSYSLIKTDSWQFGYYFVGIIQVVLSFIILISLPLWNKGGTVKETDGEEIESVSLTFREIFRLPCALPCFVTFFAYCSLELTTSLWASSYLIERWHFSPEAAAGFASLFYLGIMFGRLVNGFLAMKLSDHTLIRMGCLVIALGIGFLFYPWHYIFSLVGFVVMGLGCAPIYPCIVHMTPSIFGKEKSQAVIGVQMAFAYTGFLIMPPLFGFLADAISIMLLPTYVLVLLVTMFLMHENVLTYQSNKKR